MFRRVFLIIVLILCNMLVYAQVDEGSKTAARELVEVANEIYFETRAIIQANETYVAAANLDPENLEANYMAGYTFLQTIFKSQATTYLERVYNLDPKYKFNILYMIGQSYQYGLKFNEAIDYYNQYLKYIDNNPAYSGQDRTPKSEVSQRIKECKNGIYHVANKKDYKIVNLGEKVNSPWPDYGPVLTADETILVFTSRRQEGNLNEDVFEDLLFYEDIFITTRPRNGIWGQAQNIGTEINGPYHDSNLAISADGTKLFTYKGSSNGKGDIYVSDLQDNGKWSEPKPLPNTINSTFEEKSMSLSPDGNTIFFSSDRPTSIGGLDIFYATKDRKGNWGAAKNLGEIINTEFDEDGPFLDYDGKTLFFSSRGHDGMGGFDIYRSVYDSMSESWSKPLNLGYPMNTPDNDIYFVSVREPNTGYYASAREDGIGFTDIYKIYLTPITEEDRPSEEFMAKENPTMEEAKKENGTQQEEPAETEVVEEPEQQVVVEEEPEQQVVVEEEPEQQVEVEEEPEQQAVVEEEPVQNIVEGPTTTVTKNADEKPVVILLLVQSSDNKAPLSNVKVSLKGPGKPAQIEAMNNGLYRLEFTNEEAMTYALNVEKAGYMFKSSPLHVPAMSSTPIELKRRIELDQLKTGYVSVLRNVYFDYGSAKIKPESKDEIDRVTTMMNENPSMKVEIAGHTDNRGILSFNMKLSENRAKAIVESLVKNGVDPNQLNYKGYGPTEPIASNDDEHEGRELNRRVEFRVIQR